MLEVVTGVRYAILAALFAVASFSHANNHQSWQQIAELSVAPNALQVVLVEQLGADLAIRVTNGKDITYDQEGADVAFGSEVLVLDNNTSQLQTFTIDVANVFHGPQARYTIYPIVDPSKADIAAARAVSLASQYWSAGQDTNTVLSILQPHLEVDIADSLSRAVRQHYLGALGFSGRAAEVLSLLEPQQQSFNTPAASHIFYRWALGRAYWQAGQMQSAWTTLENLRGDLTLAPWQNSLGEAERVWFSSRIDADLGAVRLLYGRQDGDTELMAQAGDLLRATRLKLENSPHLILKARLSEYLGNYYNITFRRTNVVGAQLLAEAEQLYRQAGDHLNLASILNNSAYAELGRGNVAEALDLYLRTLELQKQSRHVDGKAHVRSRLGYLYFTLGDYERAEVRYRESIELYLQLNLPQKLIQNELELAQVYRSDGRAEQALTMLLATEKRLNNDTAMEDKLRFYTQLAHTHLDLHNHESAKLAAQYSVNGADLLSDHGQAEWAQLSRLFYRLDHYGLQARIALVEGDPATALQWLDYGLKSVTEEDQEPLQQLELLSLQMQAYQQLGDFDLLLAKGDRALELIDGIRGQVDFQTQAPRWAARNNHVVSFLAAQFLAKYQISKDWEVLESAFALLQNHRSRSLRELRHRQLRNNEDHELAQLHSRLLLDRQRLINALLRDLPTQELERQVARSEERYSLKKAEQYQSTSLTPILALAQIQEALSPGTVVLFYCLSEPSSYLLRLSTDNVSVTSLPSKSHLSLLLSDTLQQLQPNTSQQGSNNELAEALGLSLLSEQDRKILIEADGLIATVPFAVISSRENNSDNNKSFAYLPSISEYFSAAVASNSDSSNIDDVRKDLVVISDPLFATDEGSSGDSDWRAGLGALPFSRLEAQAVAAPFIAEKVSSFFQRQATIDNLLTLESRQARILHIATHGFASEDNPFFLGLAFANNPETDSSGLLTEEHIINQVFDNELVVISACETAQGQVLDGEGVMSVSRAFLASGAKATVSTLWPVSDRANASFMEAFYYGLKILGYPADQALVYAQSQLRRQRQYGHPYYWGAFVLQVIDPSYQPVSSTIAIDSPFRP